MRAGRRAVNCVPCAKRKVRCDKEQPCGHCKRRKQDVCEYPDPVEHEKAKAEDERVHKLENYIRSLGRDPLELYSLDERDAADRRLNPRRRQEAHDSLRTITWGEGQRRGLGCVEKTAAIANSDEDNTYIEAPMWYSWNGASRPRDVIHRNLDENAQHEKLSSARTTQWIPTLLERQSLLHDEQVSIIVPLGKEANSLWSVYLENVHPLVKIFFDWETAPLMQRASNDFTKLTLGEKSLALAIYFIATLSLPLDTTTASSQESRLALLRCRQKSTEAALLDAELMTTADKRVLQGFILYMLAMRNRARPSTLYSLMGIAVRISERMGMHRDGTTLGLGIVRTEERRRMWWQLQNMEISVGQLTGSISMTLYADWDTKLPSNVEDGDLYAGMTHAPPERHGLTSISHCLWRYCILDYQRLDRDANGRFEGLLWLLSPHVSLEEKDARINEVNKRLSERFIIFCDPLVPLHQYIQIGIRAFHLAGLRTARQPSLVNAKISEMSSAARKEFLDICVRASEYYILCQESKGLDGFRWHTENYFQWTAFVYVVLEAHHRYDKDEVLKLWSLIQKVFALHPELSKATDRPETAAVAELTVSAWQKRSSYLRQQREVSMETSMTTEDQHAVWIRELCSRFGLAPPAEINTQDAAVEEDAFDTSQFLPADFDFDAIDWSFWQDPHLDMTTFGKLD